MVLRSHEHLLFGFQLHDYKFKAVQDSLINELESLGRNRFEMATFKIESLDLINLMRDYLTKHLTLA